MAEPMPRAGVIHDLGYRPYDGPRVGEGRIALALFAGGFRNAFGLGRSGKSKVMPFLLLAINLLPGETARLALDLHPGLYKVECLVDGHDDLGMEGFLEVRTDASLVRDRMAAAGTDEAGSGDADDIAIADFTFAPADLEVAQGTEVTWSNDDPAPHTVTAEDGSFDSGTLEPGQTFSVSVPDNGLVTYRCEIHPDMVGTITVR